jgi:hypothetical protein
VNFHPTDTHTTVSCAAFQACDDTVEVSSINFLLGFQDGRIVLYRLSLPGAPGRLSDSQLHLTTTYHLQPVRIGVIKRLHKPAMGGVTAADFIPGSKLRVVSIRHDGRCRLVDFGSGGQVLRT